MEKSNPASINVTDIMKDIREEIKKKGYSSDMLSFADVPLDVQDTDNMARFDTDILHSNVEYLSHSCTAKLGNPNTGNPFSRFFKRLAVRMLGFYLEPYADKQNSLNACTAQAQEQVELYIQESRMHSTRALLERIEMLELQQKNMHINMDQMQEQIRLLQDKLSEEEQE